MPKNNMKCVRMTDKVLAYVEKMEGIGFNQQFENMVLYCMEEEDRLQDSIDRLQREKAALADEILTFRKLQGEIRYIDIRVREITNRAINGVGIPGQQAL